MFDFILLIIIPTCIIAVLIALIVNARTDLAQARQAKANCLAKIVEMGETIDGLRDKVERRDILLEQHSKEFEDWGNRYAALEEGMDEEQENYEQQFLSFQEILGNQTDVINALQLENHALMEVKIYHEAHCLPSLDRIRVGKL